MVNGLDDDKIEMLKSVYNEGSLQIARISNILNKCNYYSSNGMLDKWRWSLDVFFRELSNDILKLDESNGNNYMKKIDKFRSEIKDAMGVGDRSLVYRLLDEFEVYLRVLQHKAGKGSKYFDESEDSIDE